MIDTFRRDLIAVLPAWIVARLLVVGTMLGVRLYVDHLHDGDRPLQVGQGLLAWDGAWYRSLVESGYPGPAPEGIRFFPGFVLLGRLFDVVLPGGAGPALLFIANVTALVAMALLLRLVREVTGDSGLAGRAVWLTACFPPAFVLVWGYAEALFLLLAVATFLALSRRHWWWAAGLATAAALTRPTGALLAVAALASVWPGWRSAPAGERIARTAAVIGGPVGFGPSYGGRRPLSTSPLPRSSCNVSSGVIPLTPCAGSSPGSANCSGRMRSGTACTSRSPWASSSSSSWRFAGCLSGTQPLPLPAWWSPWRPTTSTASSAMH